MNRIEQIFKQQREQGAKTLMPFVTAGDPDLATTEAILPKLEQAGAHICELGIPFSDPVADGPIIQASMARALDKGLRPGDVLEMVKRQRDQLNLGLVAMVSYSIVFRSGVEAYIKSAKAAGIDGLIVPDLPVTEADTLLKCAKDHEITCSLLIAPTTPLERAETVARACSGFLYVLARAGLTGLRKELPADLPDRINALRNVTDLPIAVGFGVSSPEHVAEVVKVADAAIVGSAIVKCIEASEGTTPEAIASDVGKFVADLAGGLKSPA